VRKLGLIAGGGDLPLRLAAHCADAGRPLHVVRLRGMADAALASYPGGEVALGEVGKAISLVKKAGCENVCFAGQVQRPDLRNLAFDAGGMALLPKMLSAARSGDDALLRVVLGAFEAAGLIVEGAHEVMASLTLPAGPLGAHAPPPDAMADVARALDVARAIGSFDIGQGAVVCDGLVLAVEAQEGTDAMLRRVAELPAALRGAPGAPRGVLAKAPKPIQETRVDLPTMGLATLEGVARAGLAGIAGEAGRVLVLDRERLIARADELGLFVVGVLG
jgi:hypothetical protein